MYTIKKLSIFNVLFMLFFGLSIFNNTPLLAKTKDTLVVSQGADAKSLDPDATNDQPSSCITCQIYDRLVEQENDMTFVPSLAESWEQTDQLSTVFHLRKGIKFHNGEELKASDVKFSLERMKASPQVSYIIEAIDKIEIIDDHTVKITTLKPFGALLSHLSHTAAAILNEKAVKESGDTYGQHPVGTGPYKFVEWKVGDRVVLEANNDYFLGKPAIKNVIFRNIPENTNRSIGLETGEIDISYGIEPIDKNRIKEDPNLIYMEEPSFSMSYFGVNTKKKPFDDVRVRRAIASAIDVDPIIDAIWMGSATKANSIIGPKVFGYSSNAKMWHKDIALSKKLLAEAGYPDGFKTVIWTNDNQSRKDLAVILQDQLKEIGIDLKVEILDWGAFLDGTARGDHEMFILGWSTVTGDADYGIYALVHSSTHGTAGNRSFYADPEIDKWLDDARNSSNQEERKALYAKIQEKIQEDVPLFPVAYQNNSAGMQKNVQGFKLKAAGHHKIFGVSFKE